MTPPTPAEILADPVLPHLRALHFYLVSKLYTHSYAIQPGGPIWISLRGWEEVPTEDVLDVLSAFKGWGTLELGYSPNERFVHIHDFTDNYDEQGNRPQA